VTGFLGALVCGLILIVAILTAVLLVVLNKTNQARWDARRSRGSLQADVCCLDTPCSEQCARRRSALMVAGAVDALRNSDSLRTLVQIADGDQQGPAGSALPLGDRAGRPAS
jgi:hypothetical protein